MAQRASSYLFRSRARQTWRREVAQLSHTRFSPVHPIDRSGRALYAGPHCQVSEVTIIKGASPARRGRST
jgi:hypothetical protein